MFGLAEAWSKELYETGQFDHTNPVTGNCPATLKEGFGIQAYEEVADNLSQTSEGYVTMEVTLYNPDTRQVMDGRMDSPGHRFNLLYHDHLSGAYACHGGLCTFMGLNQDGYGKGCSTAAEGEAQFSKLAACTPQQLSQYDIMVRDYHNEIDEYMRDFKTIADTDAEYEFYTAWYEELDRMEAEIDNFEC